MATKDIDDNSRPLPAPGIGVDARGGGVIDPTKNVLDLVKAESKYQDAMRDSLQARLTESHSALKEQMRLTHDYVVSFQNAQRDAETKRIDQLAQTRQEFQNTIRDMLAESVRTTSTLVSTQLVQIQATFDTRVSKLEAYQFTQAGRSSVADPALADALNRMSVGLSELKSVQDASANKIATTLLGITSTESRAGGKEIGQRDVNTRIFAFIMAAAAIAGPLITFLALKAGGH